MGARKDNLKNRYQGLVPLVFRTILKILGLLGLPVVHPLLCFHHETGTGVAAQTGHPLARQDLHLRKEPSGNGSTVDRAKQDPEKQSAKDEASDKTGNVFRETRGAKRGKAAVATGAVTSCGRTLSTEFTCRKCKIGRVLGNVVFVIFVILFSGNILRYCSVFTQKDVIDGNFIPAVVLMVFFLCTFYLYVASYHALRVHLPALLTLVEAYDRIYSVSLDCRRLGKSTKAIVLLSLILQIVLCLVLMVGLHSFLPSVRKHLAPFSDLKGLELYALSLILSVVLSGTMGTTGTIISFMKLCAYFLQHELALVAQQFALLFPPEVSKILPLEEADVQHGDLRSFKFRGMSGCFSLDLDDSEVRALTGLMSGRERSRSVKEVQKCSNPLSAENKEAKQNEVKDCKERITCCRRFDVLPLDETSKGDNLHFPYTEDILDERRTRSVCFRPNYHGKKHSFPAAPRGVFLPQDQPLSYFHSGIVQQNITTVHTSSASHDFVSEDEEDTFRELDAVLNSFDGARAEPLGKEGNEGAVDGLRHGRVSDMEERPAQNGREDDSQGAELVFNHLHTKHQLLCAILLRAQGCCGHLLAMAYICGIPTFCVVIYGLGSGSLGKDESALMIFIVVETLMAIVVCTIQGILVNDQVSIFCDQASASSCSWSAKGCRWMRGRLWAVALSVG